MPGDAHMNGDGMTFEPPSDTGDRRRRSDAKGVRARIDKATESTEAKFLARLAAPTVVIGLLAFFGLQLWNGQKEGAADLDRIADRLNTISGTLNLHEWRIDRLERDQVPASRKVRP